MKMAFVRTTALALLLFAHAATAQTPGVLPYQGRLVKADGTPETGVVSMGFSFFSAPTGGASLWAEAQQVPLTQGYYATFIGAVTDGGISGPGTLFDGAERYLEVSINGTALSPRHRIGSVPYAMRAGAATSVSGGSVNASSVSIGGTQVIDSTGKWVGAATGSGVTSIATGAGLSGGPITTTGTVSLAASGVTTGHIEDGTITFTDLSTNGCASGEIMKRNGTTWACAADQTGGAGGVASVGASAPLSSSGGANPSIAIASCPTAGQVLKWNGSAWACATDNDTAGSGVTSVNATAPLNSSGGLTPTIAIASCPSGGQVLKWNGSAWACAVDSVGVTNITGGGPILSSGGVTPQITLASCNSNQILKWNGTDWACAADETAAGGGVGAVTATAPMVSSGGSSPNVSIAACAANQILKWNGSAWACATDNDTDTNSGGTVTSVATGSGLSGGPITGAGTLSITTGGVTSGHIADGTVIFSDWASNGCASGEVSKWNGTTWSCGTDLTGSGVTSVNATAPLTSTGGTTPTLAITGCASGQVLKWNGSAWSCSTDLSNAGTVTSVATGSGLSGGPITGTGTLSIATDGVTSGHIDDGTIAFADLGQNACATNQIPKWNGTAWACASDVDTNSGGTVTSVGAGTGVTVSGTGAAPVVNVAYGTTAGTAVQGNDSRLVPVGTISAFGGTAAPTGWLLCDGLQRSRATYASLFAVIGTLYGVGDDVSTFNVPDLRQRFPLGKGTTQSLGDDGGTFNHVHTANPPSTTTDNGNAFANNCASGGANCGTHTHVVNIAQFNTGSSNPPYLVINYIIKN